MTAADKHLRQRPRNELNVPPPEGEWSAYFKVQLDTPLAALFSHGKTEQQDTAPMVAWDASIQAEIAVLAKKGIKTVLAYLKERRKSLMRWSDDVLAPHVAAYIRQLLMSAMSENATGLAAGGEQLPSDLCSQTTAPFAARLDRVKAYAAAIHHDCCDVTAVNHDVLAVLSLPSMGKTRVLIEIAKLIRQVPLSETGVKVVPLLLRFKDLGNHFSEIKKITSESDAKFAIMSRAVHAVFRYYSRSPSVEYLSHAASTLTWNDVRTLVLHFEQQLSPDTTQVYLAVLADDATELLKASADAMLVHSTLIKPLYDVIGVPGADRVGALILSGCTSKKYSLNFLKAMPFSLKTDNLGPIFLFEKIEYAELHDMAKKCTKSLLYDLIRMCPGYLGLVIDIAKKKTNSKKKVDLKELVANVPLLCKLASDPRRKDDLLSKYWQYMACYVSGSPQQIGILDELEESGILLHLSAGIAILNPVLLFVSPSTQGKCYLDSLETAYKEYTDRKGDKRRRRDTTQRDTTQRNKTAYGKFGECLLNASLGYLACYCPAGAFSVRKFVEKLAGPPIAASNYQSVLFPDQSEKIVYLYDQRKLHFADHPWPIEVTSFPLHKTMEEATAAVAALRPLGVPRRCVGMPSNLWNPACDDVLSAVMTDRGGERWPFLMLFETRFWAHRADPEHNFEVQRKAILCLIGILVHHLLDPVQMRVVFVYLTTDIVNAETILGDDEIVLDKKYDESVNFIKECMRQKGCGEMWPAPRITLNELLKIAGIIAPKLCFTVHVVCCPHKEDPSPTFHACMMNYFSFLCPVFWLS